MHISGLFTRKGLKNMDNGFDIIYADPPWQFKTYSDKGSGKKSASFHYPCMDLREIRALPVADIASDDCVLFLWITFPFLKEGIRTMEEWGFTYKTCGFNWVKRNRRADTWFMGLGYWTRSNSELCLLGTKGHPKREGRGVSQICDARIMQHSRKPAEIRERIVALCGDRPRVELFAREKTEGWVCLGNEIDGKDIREAIQSLAEKDRKEQKA